MRNGIEILHLPIHNVKPAPNHARTHNREQRRKLAALLRKFGQVTPILVDAENAIVDGHAVHAALIELGYDEIAAVIVRNRDPNEIRALRLALNRVPQDASWDEAVLRDELRTLLDLGFEMELTGFDAVEIDMALSFDEPGTSVVEAEASEDLAPPTNPIVMPGDIYRLGRHAIACGNAHDAELIRWLAGSRLVRVVFTDPPHNSKVDGFVSGLGKTHHADVAMASGKMTKAEFTAFLAGFIAALVPALADGAILFLCTDWRHLGELLEAGSREGLILKNLCVWTKSNAGMGMFYRCQHELIFVFKYGDAPHQNNFKLGQHARVRSNVWAYREVNVFGQDREGPLGLHQTLKPVLMIADALKDVSRRGDLVLDPFLGSGSTLIAAEETGRTCIGVELDPSYVEVAIRRWERRTGKDAVHVKSDETFAERRERGLAIMPCAGTVDPAGQAKERSHG